MAVEAPSTCQRASWYSPDKDWFQLNSDAAIHKTKGVAGLGVVIRNARGEFMAASTSQSSYFGDIEFAEASAILKGIKLVEDLGFLPLLIESDSVNVISLISGKISSQLEIYW